MTHSKYIDVAKFVCKCINNKTEYFDIGNLDSRVVDFIQNIGHNIKNKERLANELLVELTKTISGKFKIFKEGKVFDNQGTCWIQDCIVGQRNMNNKQKINVCDNQCIYKCKNCTMEEKIKHLDKNTVLRYW